MITSASGVQPVQMNSVVCGRPEAAPAVPPGVCCTASAYLPGRRNRAGGAHGAPRQCGQRRAEPLRPPVGCPALVPRGNGWPPLAGADLHQQPRRAQQAPRRCRPRSSPCRQGRQARRPPQAPARAGAGCAALRRRGGTHERPVVGVKRVCSFLPGVKCCVYRHVRRDCAAEHVRAAEVQRRRWSQSGSSCGDTRIMCFQQPDSKGKGRACRRVRTP